MNYLKEYVFEDDDISLRVNDEYKISSIFDVNHYMHGRYYLFALMAS